MEMPFSVRPISPARKALLLCGSSQESVPGMNVGTALRVFERGDRLRAVDHDLVLLVDHLAAVRPHQPVAPALASPTALPSANPPGVPLALSACAA